MVTQLRHAYTERGMNIDELPEGTRPDAHGLQVDSELFGVVRTQCGAFGARRGGTPSAMGRLYGFKIMN